MRYCIGDISEPLIDETLTQATANDWMSDPAFKKLPLFPRMKARAGWFQGSVFFFIIGTSSPFPDPACPPLIACRVRDAKNSGIERTF